MSKADDMTVCVSCGGTNNIEHNHIGGRANASTLTAPMCRTCHQIFTALQYRHRIPLKAEDERSDVIKMAAVAVGFMDMMRIAAQRTADHNAAGLLRELWDAIHPALAGTLRKPDALKPAPVATPTPGRSDARMRGVPDAGRLAGQAAMFASVLAPLWGGDHALTRLCAAVATNAAPFIAWADTDTRMADTVAEFAVYARASVRVFLAGGGVAELVNAFTVTGVKLFTELAEQYLEEQECNI